MNKNKLAITTLLPLLIFIGIAYFFWRGLSLDPHFVPSALIHKSAPDFNLPDLTQDVFLNRNIFLGHVSLLNVWATWCISCIDEHAMLLEISHAHTVLIYGLDYKDDKDTALNFLKKYGNPYDKIGFDQTGYIAINWGVYGTPETFIIDKRGIIRYKQIGPITQGVWQNILLPIVNKLQNET